MWIKQPLDDFLNFKYERISEDHIKIHMPVKPICLNSLGVVHGGIISSLADAAMCNVPKNDGGTQTVVTVNLNISFIRPAGGDYLLADAHIFKKGKSLVHSDCFIYDDQERLVAKASGILHRSKESK